MNIQGRGDNQLLRPTFLTFQNHNDLLLYIQVLFKVKFYNTVKPAHGVTSIKQSLVFKGHSFLVLS